MEGKPKMFVALSYAKKDERVNQFILDLLENDFSIIPANILNVEPPQEKVPNLIKDAEIFSVILTKRYNVGKTKKWKPSDWVQQEIGMAQALNRHCLIFKEEEVELSGIESSITSIGTFNRKKLEQSAGEFIQGIRDAANKIKEERIAKIEGWLDTKRVIEDIIEGAEKYVYGIVEDFSTIDKFENSLSQLHENIEFLFICSPFGEDLGKLERTMNSLKCKRKEIRFIHPSKIGRVRILFNEKFGLFVIHARGNEYFGIRITPIDDLKNHFKVLKEESNIEKEPVRLEGKFYHIGPNDLAESLIWAIKGISYFEKKKRFLYILASKFTLFIRNNDLRDSIIDLAKRKNCRIKIILTHEALNRGNYPKSLYEIIKDSIGKYKQVKIYVLSDNYPIGQRRIIITNKLGMDILDFGDEGYSYSVVQDPNQIEIMKKTIEEIYLNRKDCFINKIKYHSK